MNDLISLTYKGIICEITPEAVKDISELYNFDIICFAIKAIDAGDYKERLVFGNRQYVMDICGRVLNGRLFVEFTKTYIVV